MTIANELQAEGTQLTECERRIWLDIEWADHNEAVREKYAGQWVAVYDRSVVAHGNDPEQVLSEAVVRTQRSKDELAIWPILSDASFLSDSPPSELEP
jgi:hypothetical protein